MLQGGYLSVMESRNEQEFRHEIVRFSQQRSFETVSAITVIDHPMASPTLPSTMRRRPSATMDDPVARAHRSGDAAPQEPQRAHHLEPGHLHQARAGRAGKSRRASATAPAFACAAPARGAHFVFGVDREQAAKGSDRGHPHRRRPSLCGARAGRVPASSCRRKSTEAPCAHPARARVPALDHEGKTAGGRRGCSASANEPGVAFEQRHAQVGVVMKASGGAEGTSPGLIR